MSHIQEKGRWLIRQIAQDMAVSEGEAEAAINELIDHGHLRVRHGEGPNGLDLFEMVGKEHGK